MTYWIFTEKHQTFASLGALMFFVLFTPSVQVLAAPLCSEVYQETEMPLHSLSVLDDQFRIFFDHMPTPKDKTPLVFLNGFSLSFEHSSKFDSFVTQMGRKLVRVDLVGVGHSLKDQLNRGIPLTEIPLEVQVRATIELLESLPSKKARLIGHSYGSTVSAAVAKERPDLVERLILISPYLMDLPLLNPRLRNLQHMSDFWGSINPWIRASNDLIRRKHLSSSFKGVMPEVLRNDPAAYNESLFYLSEGIRDFVMAEVLKDVRVKTDILFGSEDPFISAKQFEEAFLSLPAEQRGRLTYLEDKHDLVGIIPHEVADFIVND